MKKIMFNDHYGLTQAVLEGRKTMTRRFDTNKRPYRIGEEVAVAMSYKSIYDMIEEQEGNGSANDLWCEMYDKIGALGIALLAFTPGYSNKMYVKADFMPYRIRISDIKVEQLQDISDEDCMKEGLLAGEQEPRMYGFRLPKGTVLSFPTPRAAFASLIDRISGKGTFDRNPWVFAYEFDLIK